MKVWSFFDGFLFHHGVVDVWSCMSRIANADTLWTAVQEEWRAIPKECLACLYDSLPNGCARVPSPPLLFHEILIWWYISGVAVHLWFENFAVLQTLAVVFIRMTIFFSSVKSTRRQSKLTRDTDPGIHIEPHWAALNRLQNCPSWKLR